MQTQTSESKEPKVVTELSLRDLGEFKNCPRRNELRVEILSTLVGGDNYGQKCLMGVFECKSGRQAGSAEWYLECTKKFSPANCVVSGAEVNRPSCKLPIKLFHRSEIVLKPEEDYHHF